MRKPIDLSVLMPGDVLLYEGSGFWSWFIKVKTWSDYSHVEVYIGGHESVASRDGEGVGRYHLRVKGLSLVLRPNEPFDLARGMAWFETVQGRPYDWWGLARFFRMGKYSDAKMFCSEFATHFLRQCALCPLAGRYEADKVSPGMFAASPHFDVVADARDTPHA
jgi:hypothetical protein